MAIALVNRQRHTVGAWPHHIARVVAVTDAKGMANLMKADVVNHHVAHERIFFYAAPDGWTEPVFIRAEAARPHGVPALHRRLHASARRIRRPRQPADTKSRPLLAVDATKANAVDAP